MKRVAFVAIFVVIASIVAIAKLPASIVVGFIPTHAARWIGVHEIDGTLWRGHAKVSLPIALPAAQEVKWHCTPSLFEAAVMCELSGAVSGNLRLRPLAQALEIENVSAVHAVNASPNSAVAVSSAPLTLSLARGSVSASAINLEGSALAKQVTWRGGAQTLEFGEVSLDCKPSDANSTECAIRNRAAPTSLDGKITLTPQRASGFVEYGVAGTAKQRVSF